MTKLTTVGSIELIDFVEYGASNLPCKIDTGAYSGALHCTSIEEVSEAGVKKIRFSRFDDPNTVIEVSDYSTGRVKSSNGEVSNRFFISTRIRLQDIEYDIKLSLADRKSMKWPILIGRRFLRENKILVDVCKASPSTLTESREDI
jgi:hypothetical protein